MSISPRRAKDVVIDAIKGAKNDNILHWAAAIAYYSALSFAPLLLVIMIGASFFTDVDWAANRLSTVLGNFLPDQSEGQMREFVSNAVQSRNRIGIFSIIAFLYTGTRVFASLTRALHVIYDQESERNFIREFIVQAVMLLTIGGAFIVALSSRFLLGALGVVSSGGNGAAQQIVSGLVQVILLFIVFVLVYRFVPSQEDEWRPPLFGAGVATLLFVVVRPLFIFYLNRFGNQEIVYGSLASLVILLLWIWIGAVIALFGGSIANSVRQSGQASSGSSSG